MTVARIVAVVFALNAVLVALLAGIWAAAGPVPVPLRFWIAAMLTLDAAILWGMFERRAPLFGRIVSRARPRARAIAITFDDGPTEPYTSQILDVLRAYDARATFFVLGARASAAPEVVRRAASEGHEIANHGWDHQPLPLHGPRHIRETIERTSALVAHITGRRPSFFRAPFGWRNPWVNSAARRQGCRPIAWTVGVHDTDRPGAMTIAQRAIGALQSGTILLLHDGRSLDPSPDAGQVVEALPAILRAARDRGFEFLTVSALLASSE